MEHRWGQRVPLNLDVQLNFGSLITRRCRMSDASVSGAFVSTALDLPLLAGIVVVFEGLSPGGRRIFYRAQACVVRKTADGIGVEWNELDPPGFGVIVSVGVGDKPHRPGIEVPEHQVAKGSRGS